MIEQALEYGRLGWRVLPLWHVTLPDPLEAGRCACPRGANCPSPGKHPRLQRGSTDASSEERVIRGWWERWPDANVGVATGPESGLYIVDLDGPEAIAAWAELASALPPFGDWIVRTGSGQHHYFACTDPLPNTAGRIARGIDTRGTGGYVVAPPSVHYKRLDRYEWIARGHDGPPEVPQIVRDAVTPRSETPSAPPRVTFGESTAYAKGVLRHALERLAAAPEGQRNDTLNAEAFLLGQWIGGGELDPSGVAGALEAAHPRPCDLSKVRSTIRRSLVDGSGHPKTKADE